MSQGRHDDEHLYVEKYRSGGGGGGGTAAGISYDDTQTHLGTDNVQGAIEAINRKTINNASQIETLTANKQDKLTPGTGINIDANNVISATNNVVAQYDSTYEQLIFN